LHFADDGIVGSNQLDKGARGALFGIAAGPDDEGDQVIYFNDDNDARWLLTSGDRRAAGETGTC
jgi:hypothetical protein